MNRIISGIDSLESKGRRCPTLTGVIKNYGLPWNQVLLKHTLENAGLTQMPQHVDDEYDDMPELEHVNKSSDTKDNGNYDDSIYDDMPELEYVDEKPQSIEQDEQEQLDSDHQFPVIGHVQQQQEENQQYQEEEEEQQQHTNDHMDQYNSLEEAAGLKGSATVKFADSSELHIHVYLPEHLKGKSIHVHLH